MSCSRYINSETQTSPHAKKHADLLAATITTDLQQFEAARRCIVPEKHEKENIPGATTDIISVAESSAIKMQNTIPQPGRQTTPHSGTRLQPRLGSQLATITKETAATQHKPSVPAVQITKPRPLSLPQSHAHNFAPSADDPLSLPLRTALAETETYLRETATSAIDNASNSLARALASTTQAMHARQATYAGNASLLHTLFSDTRFVVTSSSAGGLMSETTLNARVDALRKTLQEERATQAAQWRLQDEVDATLAALPGECMDEIGAVRKRARLECDKVVANLRDQCAHVLKDVHRWEDKYAKIKDKARAMVAKATEELGQNLDNLDDEAEDARGEEGSAVDEEHM